MADKIAGGERLTMTQDEINVNGHAIEFRINAEDPYHNFMPSPGLITQYIAPGGYGVRIDSACYTNYKIPPFYDSMVAKLIVHDKDRETALNTAYRALNEFIILGIETTIPFHMALIENEIFRSNQYNTKFLEEHDIMS